MKQLSGAGYIFLNNGAVTASAMHPVPKPKAIGAYRLTEDYHAINSMTERAAWPMPILEVILQQVAGSKFFLFKCYWQFPLDESCQELFSFATDKGVWTPIRVMQGHRRRIKLITTIQKKPLIRCTVFC